MESANNRDDTARSPVIAATDSKDQWLILKIMAWVAAGYIIALAILAGVLRNIPQVASFVFSPPFLIPVFNTFFFFLIGLAITWYAKYIFLRIGFQTVLWLGTAAFTIGLSAFIAGWFTDISGHNFNITVYSMGVGLASIFNLIGASLVFWRNPGLSYRKRLAMMVTLYAFVLFWVALIAMGASNGVFPVFFIQGSGVTTLGKVVLAVSGALFVLAGMFLLRAYVRSKRAFWIWYASGLFWFATGLIIINFFAWDGDLIYWLGRSAQYGGFILLLTAVISVVKESYFKNIPVEQVIAEFSSRSKVNYERLVNSAEEAIIAIDDRCRVITWNPAAEKMFGYRQEEVIGKGFFNLVFSQAQLDTYQYAAAAKSEMVNTSISAATELKARRKDGQEFPVELTLVNGKNDKGWFTVDTTTILIIRDIKERKKSEEALKRSEEKYRTLFNTMQEAFALCEILYDETGKASDFRFIDINPVMEKYIGLPKSEILGKTARTLFPHVRAELIEDYGKVVATGENLSFEMFNRFHQRWYNVFAYRTSPDSFAYFTLDITERKKAEKLKDDFIGMVSHEIRTPLTVINGALHILERPGLSPADYHELVQDAIASANTMSGIIDNLLELSRSQANRLELHLENADVVNIASGVIKKLRDLSEIHRLKLDAQENLPVIQADPIRLERILYNLVENAIKYSPAGGEVLISIKNEEKEMVFCVKDQGPGISLEDQKRLFHSFEQLDMPNRRSIQGVGLGLKVCRTLVEAHGGRIWVDSEPGKGATFCFTLPVKKPKPDR